ncbi:MULTISPECIES: hypothetical protein [unclassified Campylobacter]|uniref:hypothetical protein n=1 Tax=unclassified Campylobacter TaxID=2593542 RepID=UPI00301DB162
MFKSRLFMNLKGISNAFIPRFIFQKKLDKIFNEILKYKDSELEYIATRVNYYNQIKNYFSIENHKENKIGKLPFKIHLMRMMLMKLANILKIIFYGIKNF